MDELLTVSDSSDITGALKLADERMYEDKEKFYMNFADTGNTVCASIPIDLKRAMEEGVVKPNQTILLSGFGVGLSWGSTVIKTGAFAL